jgi:hypothetical protein
MEPSVVDRVSQLNIIFESNESNESIESNRIESCVVLQSTESSLPSEIRRADIRTY